MSEITLETVEYVAGLAQLEFSAEDKARLAGDLSRILSYIEKLNELDTSEVEPMMHTLDLVNVFREDAVEPALARDLALANAPASDGEYFLVPKILDTSE